MELTQQERDQMIAKVQADVTNSLALLKSLGVGEPDAMETTSPDGGSISRAHKFLKPVLSPMREVLVKGDDGKPTTALIRVDDFDSKIHTPVAGKGTRAVVSLDDEDEDEPVADFSAETRDELLVYTVDRLKEMPEAEFVDSMPSTKSDIVDAILEVRAGLAK